MAKDNKNEKKKQSTDSMIDEAIAKQNAWLENRRTYTRGFLKKLDTFARKKDENQSIDKKEIERARNRRSVIGAYWFPILCALVVIFIAIWVAFVRQPAPQRVVVVPAVPEPVVQAIDTMTAPTFDIVRIEKNGSVVIAGRWLPHQNISIVVNGKIVATERTDSAGEFVYAPSKPFAAGNYTISLMGTEPTVKSEDKVFVYVSEAGAENSVSLLMTRDGSTLLQAPSMLRDGDLSVSKIDYLDTGRIVVTGDALPRLRVSLSLNDKYMGFARVSDHHHFGLGADVGELESGKEYSLTVRMHDGDGRTVASVTHDFVMPEMTGDDDTFYTVRRGDCLWIIARNFLRRGILFSIIAERNNIENPDLIYPKQLLQIPVEK
ncbi:MAG: LysM peptidoglycan-binding domain-containing protein [Alphaproteobacteria bacterium]|nr:LysM peptidoglycan-binding domain-containing protein [Alphaproteobacteria bacterium]